MLQIGAGYSVKGIFFWWLFASGLFIFSSCTTQRSTAIVDYGKSLQAPAGGVIAEEAVEEIDTVASATIVMDEEQLAINYIERANRAINFYLKSQTAFRLNQFGQALILINRSLETQFTADACALKGSILYKMGSVNEAFQYWKMAYDSNPESINVELPGFREAYEALFSD